MTFFVCFYLLLGFLIIHSIIVYVKGSSSDKDAGNSNKESDNFNKGSSNEANASKSSAPQHILDLEAYLDKMQKENRRKLNEKPSKQDSSDVVNDGSEPTPLTDLDGGDG